MPLDDKATTATETGESSKPGSSQLVRGKGKLDVGEYRVSSKVDSKGKRYWPCPVENCNEYFGSSRKCGAHLNEHLGRIYECDKCKYQTYNLDSYEHHICFSGPKTQSGASKEGVRYRKKSTASKRKADTSSDPPRRIKKEKETVEDVVIVLD